MNALHFSVSRNNLQSTKFLIKHYFDPAEPCFGGLSALHVAAREGAFECVKLIMFYNGTMIQLIDNQTNDGFTALHFAAFNNDAHVVLALLLFEADPSIQDDRKMTPLDLAIKVNSTECINLLSNYENIKKQLQINFGKSKKLISENKVQELDSLLKQNPLLADFFDIKDGITLLHIAASYGSIECVKTILKYATNVNPHNINWETPLFNICKDEKADPNNFEPILDEFMKKGADLKLYNKEWKHLLSHLCIHGGSGSQILSILKYKDIRLSNKIPFNGTELPIFFVFASYDMYLRYIQQIYETDPSTKAFTKPINGKTALLQAYENNALEIFKFLILTVKVTPFKKENKWIYFNAAKDPNRIEYLKVILQSKPGSKKLAIKDDNNKTALEIAKQNNNEQAFELIFQEMCSK